MKGSQLNDENINHQNQLAVMLSSKKNNGFK
jgi:hypothetical protein